jgi:hypothetical protein
MPTISNLRTEGRGFSLGQRWPGLKVRPSVRGVLAGAFVVATLVVSAARAQEQLLDRALAIVGGQVVTESDARTMLELALVDGGNEADPLAVATQKLIDRVLMLREVDRYAPPEPSADVVESRLAVARSRFPSPEAFAAALAAGGMTEQRLRGWVRDDYRIAGYLEQRFAAAGTPTDQEVSDYYNEHLDEFQRGGLTFEQAGGLIRDRLAAERRGELITDWVSDLRRRTEIVQIKQD